MFLFTKPSETMRYAAFVSLVALLFASPLKAQDSDGVTSMLQYVLDLPEMEEVFDELGIREELCLAQTSVVPPGIRLVKFGRDVVVHEDEESAFFRCGGAFVTFTDIAKRESSSVSVRASVHGRKTHPVGADTEVSLVLKTQPEGWSLERFRRDE